jgi:hypothetical protein
MVDRSRALEAMALEELRREATLARAQREEENERTGKEDRTDVGLLGIWAGRGIQPGSEAGS